MTRIILLLTCLAGVTHGRRMQSPADLRQHSDLPERLHVWANARRMVNSLPLRALEMRLLNSNASAAFNPMGPGARPTAGKSTPSLHSTLLHNHKNVRSALPVAAAPANLNGLDFIPEVEALEFKDASMSMNERLGSQLEWLQEMLQKVPLADDDKFTVAVLKLENVSDEEMADRNFVDAGKPWLHLEVENCHLVQGAGIVEEIWSTITAKEFMKPGSKGGTILFFLPEGIDYDNLEVLADEVDEGVSTSVVEDVEVRVFHPESTDEQARSPAPMMMVFIDSDELVLNAETRKAIMR